jgi:signal transduction histidine kinase
VCFAREALDELLANPDAETVADVSSALTQAVSGLSRIAEIVKSMRVFAHPGRVKTTVDLDRAIRSALVVAAGEYKLVADVVLEIDELPPVIGYAGDLNQALLNLMINAGQAIAEVVSRDQTRGTLRVSARRAGDDVEIAIADTGPGIPEAIRERIFDPFFTTKEVGHGTGQGLTVVHAVVVELHGGSIAVETEVGSGSTFIIRIPISGVGAS